MKHLKYICKNCGDVMHTYTKGGFFGSDEPKHTWHECLDCGTIYEADSDARRVFISMPMKGKFKEDIRKAFVLNAKRAEDKLGAEIMPLSQLTEFTTPVEALGESIAVMGNADIVYFAEGWNLARGCCIEHLICTEYDIPSFEFMPEDDMKTESGLLSE